MDDKLDRQVDDLLKVNRKRQAIKDQLADVEERIRIAKDSMQKAENDKRKIQKRCPHDWHYLPTETNPMCRTCNVCNLTEKLGKSEPF